jgi:antirestriction protein ArdC
MPAVPEIITERILKQLEQGVAPWRKPWSTSIPQNLISRKPYRGLNVFLLATQGYGSPYWVTFNQAKQLDARYAHRCAGSESRCGQEHGSGPPLFRASSAPLAKLRNNTL